MKNILRRCVQWNKHRTHPKWKRVLKNQKQACFKIFFMIVEVGAVSSLMENHVQRGAGERLALALVFHFMPPPPCILQGPFVFYSALVRNKDGVVVKYGERRGSM